MTTTEHLIEAGVAVAAARAHVLEAHSIACVEFPFLAMVLRDEIATAAKLQNRIAEIISLLK